MFKFQLSDAIPDDWLYINAKCNIISFCKNTEAISGDFACAGCNSSCMQAPSHDLQKTSIFIKGLNISIMIGNENQPSSS